MRIAPVNFNTQNYSNKKISQPKTNPSQNTHLSYQTKPQSTPAFGSSMIEDMYYYMIRTLNNRREQQRKEQIRQVEKKIQDDTAILAQRLGVSKEEAEQRYNEYIALGGLPYKGSGKEVGLNRIMGYSQEKLDLIRDGVTPIVMQVKATRDGEELPEDIVVPNGILLYGPTGTGKSYMADAFLEHARQKDSLIKTKPRETIPGRHNILLERESMQTTAATIPLSAKIFRSLMTDVDRPEISFPST